MGEKKLKEYLTFDGLAERFGWSKSFFYKNCREFESAILKINGRAVRPYKFDVEIVEKIVSTAPKEEPKKLTKKLRDRISKLEARKISEDEVDDLWQP